MEATDHVPETLSADLNQISSIEEMMPVLRFMFTSLEVQEDDDEFSIRTNWMRWSAEQFSTKLDGTRPEPHGIRPNLGGIRPNAGR